MKPGPRESRRKYMRSFAALLLVISMPVLPAQQKKRATPATAPAPPAEPVTFPLEVLRVQGNRRIPTAKILAVAGLKIGAPLVKADFDDARGRLLATGAFESVAYEFKPSAAKTGYDGVFEVVEVDQLYTYRFEDLPVPEDALRVALRKQEPLLGEQIPATPEVIGRYLTTIQPMVDGDVKVIGKLSTDIPGQTMIVFRPSSPRPSVAEVRFTGNDVLPSAVLTRTLNGVAIGASYSEVTMRLFLDSAIRPLYEARGRIRVAFPAITTERAKTADGVVVIIAVSEGPSYNLGKVRFAGVSAADAEELEKTANIRGEDIANFDDIKEGLDRIFHRYRNKGYLKVTGRIDRDVHDADHTVDVVLNVDPGPQFTMGKLEIAGLDITSEPAIRKIWGLKPGVPFQPGYPDSFLNNVREEGLFDNLGKTRAETKIDDQSKTVDVTLYFAGAAIPAKKTQR